MPLQVAAKAQVTPIASYCISISFRAQNHVQLPRAAPKTSRCKVRYVQVARRDIMVTAGLQVTCDGSAARRSAVLVICISGSDLAPHHVASFVAPGVQANAPVTSSRRLAKLFECEMLKLGDKFNNCKQYIPQTHSTRRLCRRGCGRDDHRHHEQQQQQHHHIIVITFTTLAPVLAAPRHPRPPTSSRPSRPRPF
jgi:hypothetical protein